MISLDFRLLSFCSFGGTPFRWGDIWMLTKGSDGFFLEKDFCEMLEAASRQAHYWILGHLFPLCFGVQVYRNRVQEEEGKEIWSWRRLGTSDGTEGLYRWNLGLQFLAYWGHLVEKLCLGEGPWNCSRLVAGNGMNWIRVEEKLGHSRRELENRIEGWHQIQSPL